MPYKVTQVWTDNVSVIAAQVLARGSSVRATLDLSAKEKACLHASLGRGGTAALTNGVDLLIRPMVNGSTIRRALTPWSTSQTAAAASTTVGADSNSGQNELKLAAIAGLAAGDILCIQDAGGGVTRLEWGRISKLTVASGTGVTLDAPLQYSHTAAQADTVRNKADDWAEMWLRGGAIYEVIFDYGDDAAGDSATVRCLAQTHDYDQIALI